MQAPMQKANPNQSNCSNSLHIRPTLQMLDHMATGEDQEDRLVAFHFTSWLKGGLETEKLG